MLKLLLSISLLLSLHFRAVWTNQTPVLLWGANSTSKPTLKLIRQNEFAELMKPLLDETAVVAFLEPNLTSMDFMCRNATTGNSCYTYMESAVPRTYYAAVQSPLQALKAIAAQVEIRSVNSVRSLNHIISCRTGTLTIISFDQIGIERNRHLQLHDSAIANISQMVKCPIVYLYMSTINSTAKSAVRVRRVAPIKKEIVQDIGTLLLHPLFVIFFKNVTFVNKHNSTNLNLTSMVVNETDSHLGVQLGTELQFNVKLDGGYYIIDEFILSGVHYRAFEVETPMQLSYFCGNLELRSNKTKLIWHSLQFQGGYGKIEAMEDFEFDDAWHCVGFFTPPILSGIFVMILLIYITSIGVCWIMDITSNDRFEDPTKEPIRISFEE